MRYTHASAQLSRYFPGSCCVLGMRRGGSESKRPRRESEFRPQEADRGDFPCGAQEHRSSVLAVPTPVLCLVRGGRHCRLFERRSAVCDRGKQTGLFCAAKSTLLVMNYSASFAAAAQPQPLARERRLSNETYVATAFAEEQKKRTPHCISTARIAGCKRHHLQDLKFCDLPYHPLGLRKLILIARFAQSAGFVWLVSLLLRPLAPRLGFPRLLALHVWGTATVVAATSKPTSGRRKRGHVSAHRVR